MTISTMDEYIASFPIEHQNKMNELRSLILEIAPQAEECMSWGMPTFKVNGNLVHFAMAKHHLGFYPGSSGVENFKDRLEAYKHSKGAIQFPLKQPVPFELIKEIVKFRLKENLGEL